MKQVTKLLVIFLVLALACIEAYLYMLLSADIGRQIRESGLSLPAGLESMHSLWLAPFGFNNSFAIVRWFLKQKPGSHSNRR